jgi:hypothetical protein
MHEKSSQTVRGATVQGEITQISDAVNVTQYIDDVTASAIRQVSESGAAQDVKEAIRELMIAVQAIAPQLPTDPRNEVVRDSTALAAEITAAKPRTEMIHAFGQALVATATTVGAVGLPIVELVSKIVALF